MVRVEYRYRVLFLLSLLSGVTAYAGRGIWAVDAFAANLAAGFVGAFATVLLIERASERRAAEERSRVLRVAASQLRRPIVLIVQLLTDMIKAASLDNHQDDPTTLEELFGPDNIALLDWLDLYSSAGQVGPADWIDTLGSWFAENLKQLSDIVAKFVAYLPVELVEALGSVPDDPFVLLVTGYAPVRKQLLATGDTRRLFTLNGTDSIRQQFFTKILRLVSEYERISEERLRVPAYYLRTDIQPLKGSGRLRDTLPPLFVGNPPESGLGEIPYMRSPAGQ